MLFTNHVLFTKCHPNAWPAWLFMKCLNNTSQCTSIYFYKMHHQHLLPIKTGHLELVFFNSGLPFIKWGLAEAFYSDKGSPFHKGMYEGYSLIIFLKMKMKKMEKKHRKFLSEFGKSCFVLVFNLCVNIQSIHDHFLTTPWESWWEQNPEAVGMIKIPKPTCLPWWVWW